MARRSNTVQDTLQNVVPTAIQNNFLSGLKTEFTGLNFPPNACTDVDNCVFSLIGDITRRLGVDYEVNFEQNTIDRTNKAISSHKWNNVGGDGETQIVVIQIGSILYFYESSAATVDAPLSTQKLSSTVDLTTFLPFGSSNNIDATECNFTDGNGYLFVFHPSLDTFYCSFSEGAITATAIEIDIRDFAGVTEIGVAVDFRPPTLSDEHKYNLINQGWTSGSSWAAYSTAPGFVIATGNQLFEILASIPAVVGESVNIQIGFGSLPIIMTGVITAFDGSGNLTVFINYVDPSYLGRTENDFIISPVNVGFIDTWFTAVGSYPSNSDIWWNFKNSSDVFDPATTLNNITLNTGRSPQGHFILPAFKQQRTLVSSVPNLTDVITYSRPKTGAWFAGRVWYAGVDASQAATGDSGYSTWTENLYFSQIITDSSQFGECYQTNDPTSQTLFGELPSDGGVLVIQGCGSVYKLFPIQNGMLVFAANGIWFITGSQGIGFTANDYTITKISEVEGISTNAYVSVQGMPVFWNEEGIYTVSAAQQGLGLKVDSITVGTIRSFYNQIPLQSKKFARGSYNPIDYVIQWVYKDTEETDITSRYQFDRILSFNVDNKAFYPYSVSNTTGSPYINDVMYVAGPGGSSTPSPTFKYFTSVPNSGSFKFTFAEEYNTDYLDWFSWNNTGIDYDSYFITGYALDGQGIREFQLGYLYMYSRNDEPTSYRIQSIWDFANSGNSGKFSSQQLININKPYFGMAYRRHRLRGQGVALQFKISSVQGKPFDIMGWSAWATQNGSV